MIKKLPEFIAEMNQIHKLKLIDEIQYLRQSGEIPPGIKAALRDFVPQSPAPNEGIGFWLKPFIEELMYQYIQLSRTSKQLEDVFSQLSLQDQRALFASLYAARDIHSVLDLLPSADLQRIQDLSENLNNALPDDWLSSR